MPPQHRGIGFIFQHYTPFKRMTVWDNVAFGLHHPPRPKAEIAYPRQQLLTLVQIVRLATATGAALGRQRRRMALARASPSAAVLLLDSRSARSTRVRKELRRRSVELHDETHVTTVFVAHDQEAMDVSDHIVVMDHGRIEQEAAAQLYEHPANEFVMSFVGRQSARRRLRRPHDIEIRLETVAGRERSHHRARRLPRLRGPRRARPWQRQRCARLGTSPSTKPSAWRSAPAEMVYAKPGRPEVFAVA